MQCILHNSVRALGIQTILAYSVGVSRNLAAFPTDGRGHYVIVHYMSCDHSVHWIGMYMLGSVYAAITSILGAIRKTAHLLVIEIVNWILAAGDNMSSILKIGYIYI